MDGYKKIIVFGCLVLAGGYFLPWALFDGTTLVGYDLVSEGVAKLRPMYDAGLYDQSYVLTFAAYALPGLGAVLAFLYCMVKPLNGNGSLATLIFLLPLLTLLAVHGFLFALPGAHPGALQRMQSIFGIMDNAIFDLRQTGGLWLVHLGALFMFLGRMARGAAPRGGLR